MRTVALLRGVNVGGHQIGMAGLADLFREAGCEDVKTYLRSGNVVFRHDAGSDQALVTDLEARMKAAYGFEVPVILRHGPEWPAILDANPYPTDDPTKVHVVFFDEAPPAKALDGMDPATYAPDEFTLDGTHVYLHLPSGMGRAKLPVALDGKVKNVKATSRNWRSVTRLAELAAALDT